MDYVLADGYNSFRTDVTAADGSFVSVVVEGNEVFSAEDSGVQDALDASPFMQRKAAEKTQSKESN